MKKRNITNYNDKYVIFYDFSDGSSENDRSTEETRDEQSAPPEK